MLAMLWLALSDPHLMPYTNRPAANAPCPLRHARPVPCAALQHTPMPCIASAYRDAGQRPPLTRARARCACYARVARRAWRGTRSVM